MSSPFAKSAFAGLTLSLLSGAAVAAPAGATADINLRSGPGTRYSVVTVIPQGARVERGSCTGNWCRVSWNGYRGYASASFLSSGGSVAGSVEEDVYDEDEPEVIVRRRVYETAPPVYVDPYPYGYGAPYYGYGYGYGYNRPYRGRVYDNRRYYGGPAIRSPRPSSGAPAYVGGGRPLGQPARPEAGQGLSFVWRRRVRFRQRGSGCGTKRDGSQPVRLSKRDPLAENMARAGIISGPAA